MEFICLFFFISLEFSCIIAKEHIHNLIFILTHWGFLCGLMHVVFIDVPRELENHVHVVGCRNLYVVIWAFYLYYLDLCFYLYYLDLYIFVYFLFASALSFWGYVKICSLIWRVLIFRVFLHIFLSFVALVFWGFIFREIYVHIHCSFLL